MSTETSNARGGVGRLVAVLDKAVAKLEVNWPNTAMDVREVRSALLNMAWEIEQHSEGARTACNDRLALRSATAPPPAAARGDVRGLVAKVRKFADALTQSSSRKAGQPWIDAQARQDVGHRLNALLDELAAEGVQAGEDEQRMIDLDRAIEVVTRFCGRTSSMTRYISEDLAALSQQPEARGVVDEACQHEWVSGDNQYVSNASVCLKCGQIAPTNTLTGERNG